MLEVQLSGPTLVLLSALLYAAGNLCNKQLFLHHQSVVSVFLFRAVATFFVNAALAQAMGGQSAMSVLLLRTPTRRSAALALARGFCGFMQVMLLNLSFDLAVSVADAFAIKEALGTIMTVVVARLLLGSDERLSARELVGVVAVLMGLLMIAQPPFLFGSAQTVAAPRTATVPRWAGFVMLVVGAAFQSAQNLLTRVLSRAGGEGTITGATMLSFYMVTLGVSSAVLALTLGGKPSVRCAASLHANITQHAKAVSGCGGGGRRWARLTSPHKPIDALLLCGVVAAGTLGQLAMAAGARTTSASKVALLAINELGFAYVFSVAVLAEPTNAFSFVGTAIVFAGSALVAAGGDSSMCPIFPFKEQHDVSRVQAAKAEDEQEDEAALLAAAPAPAANQSSQGHQIL